MENFEKEIYGETLYKKLRPYFIEITYVIGLLNSLYKKSKEDGINNYQTIINQKKELTKYYLELIFETIENEHNK